MCRFANNAKHSRIDRCLKPLMRFLKGEGYDVVACCCGHGTNLKKQKTMKKR